MASGAASSSPRASQPRRPSSRASQPAGKGARGVAAVDGDNTSTASPQQDTGTTCSRPEQNKTKLLKSASSTSPTSSETLVRKEPEDMGEEDLRRDYRERPMLSNEEWENARCEDKPGILFYDIHLKEWVWREGKEDDER